MVITKYKQRTFWGAKIRFVVIWLTVIIVFQLTSRLFDRDT